MTGPARYRPIIRTASGGNPAVLSRYRHWPFRCIKPRVRKEAVSVKLPKTFCRTLRCVTTTAVALPGDLAPEPTIGTGVLIGYARVSAGGPSLGQQLLALNEAGCVRVFTDELPGRSASAPSARRAWITCALVTPWWW